MGDAVDDVLGVVTKSNFLEGDVTVVLDARDGDGTNPTATQLRDAGARVSVELSRVTKYNELSRVTKYNEKYVLKKCVVVIVTVVVVVFLHSVLV